MKFGDLPKRGYLCARNLGFGGIAQLARALAWHARGRGFDSHYLHQVIVPYIKGYVAGVAQLVEHQLPKLRVAGSSPVSRSKGSAKCIALLLYPHLSVCFICSLGECLLQGTSLHSLDECGNSLYKQTYGVG